ncbi:ankyrin repeat-containing domain protein [Polychytrium aggregatum]|uniref:ankyrin repeat-containing domain protein n=1 Tax=Polychytrium aggregatum TaxID=110093 RepID=UPI0022FE5EBF|nr:ankyrin repeat-containing domain protein [Polychytrium aggregatum]KAI9207004.1 ankyrin repeat-containing domain protein [Polychytrium aggregatum]
MSQPQPATLPDTAALGHTAAPSEAGCFALPPEVWMAIIDRIGAPRHLVALESTCKSFRSAYRRYIDWRIWVWFQSQVSTKDGRPVQPYVLAARHGCLRVLTAWVDSDLNPDSSLPTPSPTPEELLDALRWACSNNSVPIVKILLQSPRFAAIQGYREPSEAPHPASAALDCNRPVSIAATFGHTEILRLLLSSPWFTLDRNNRAVIMASYHNQVETLQTLIEYGANIHVKDDEALVRACERGSIEVVRVLVEHGANIAARKGEALRLAKKNRHYQVISYLNQCSPQQNVTSQLLSFVTGMVSGNSTAQS